MGAKHGGAQEREPEKGDQKNQSEKSGPENQSEGGRETSAIEKRPGQVVNGGHNSGAETESWPLKTVNEGRLTVATLAKEFDTYSKAVSTICRQLTVAGFAVAWLFHQTVKGAVVDTIRIAPILWPAIVLFIMTALLDLEQYVRQANLYREALQQTGRLNLKETDLVDLVSGVHTTAHRLFDWKRRTLFAGYVALAIGIVWIEFPAIAVAVSGWLLSIWTRLNR